MPAKQPPQGFSFEQIAGLTDRETQMLLREVDTKDLAFALRGASEGLKRRILANMSDRVGTMLKEEMDFSGPVRMSDVADVRARMVDTVLELADAGQITLPVPAKRSAKRRQKLPQAYLATKRSTAALARRAMAELSLDEVTQLFVGMAEIARREGILALESMVKKAGDAYIATAVRLAVDGTDPVLIQAILEAWLTSLMHEYEVKHQKAMEGIMSIQSGDNPRIVEQKLNVLF